MLLIDANCIVKGIGTSIQVEDYLNGRGVLTKKASEDFQNEAIKRILDTLVYYKSRYSDKYGEAVLAIDDRNKNYWRKNVYDCYKLSREKLFIDSSYEKTVNVQDQFGVKREITAINLITEKWFDIAEVLKGSRFKVIEVPTCEADDIISALAKLDERHLIVSSDKDFKQLMSDKVEVFDTYHGDFRFFAEGESAASVLEQHILDGDDSDDIPPVFSRLAPSDAFRAWFKTRYRETLTDELFVQVSIAYPRIFLEYKSDMLTKYYLELGYHEPNVRDESKKKSFTTQEFLNLSKGGEDSFYAINRLPNAVKPNPKIKKAYEDSFDKRKFLENNPLIRYNYGRNKRLIDLSLIPREQIEGIIAAVKGYSRKSVDLKSLALQYEINLSDLK